MTTFQARVQPWLIECFGPTVSMDVVARNHRFLEEALELVQAAGCTQDEAHKLVDYVYGRPAGELYQEVGGVMVTLAALCLAHAIGMDEAGDDELVRCWSRVNQIRAKQARKPVFSPLPGESVLIEPSILATCEGSEHHTQKIVMRGFTKGYAEMYAGLLDGTSDAYTSKPRDNPVDSSPIGKCNICGACFNCVLVGFE